jgi:predicted membrane-bound mannosyltransferase
MAVYGYIGEKVPWLLIHQLLPVIFVAVYRMNTWKVIYSAVAVIFLAGMVWHIAFVPVDISEPIVQVQNSEDMRMVMDLIDASDKVVIASKNYWPLPWYYRGDRWDKMIFYGQITDEDTIYEQDADLVITHDEDSYE